MLTELLRCELHQVCNEDLEVSRVYVHDQTRVTDCSFMGRKRLFGLDAGPFGHCTPLRDSVIVETELRSDLRVLHLFVSSLEIADLECTLGSQVSFVVLFVNVIENLPLVKYIFDGLVLRLYQPCRCLFQDALLLFLQYGFKCNLALRLDCIVDDELTRPRVVTDCRQIVEKVRKILLRVLVVHVIQELRRMVYVQVHLIQVEVM